MNGWISNREGRHWAVNYFANQSPPWVPLMKAVQTSSTSLSRPPTVCQWRAGKQPGQTTSCKIECCSEFKTERRSGLWDKVSVWQLKLSSSCTRTGELLRKICNEECAFVLLTFGSVACWHTVSLTCLHGWRSRVTCCDLKHVTPPNYSTVLR